MQTVKTRVRPFAPDDYAAYVEVANRSYPEYGWTVEELRHEDDGWDHKRYFRVRLVAEADGAVVGAAEVHHSRGSFNPDTYWLDVTVDPDQRGRGHGSALYDAVLGALAERRGRLVRASAKESMTDGVRFLERRGFLEAKRDWESRLFVRDFDGAKFAAAPERVRAAGIRITTLAEEMARDAEAVDKAFELWSDTRRDVPSLDPVTPIDFALFRQDSIESPGALLDAFFIAVEGDRWVGLSNMFRSLEDPSFLWQGLTAVRRDARGKGVAMALKLETVKYAQRLGVEH
ncbi:MAG TPA: GNAT family N-acetyltransferase, partial [Candidatus Limnocylindrales bacterium]|nr:GNAT family N-acetyltransferase [Candidatus Limnocylindrales bacterium]